MKKETTLDRILKISGIVIALPIAWAIVTGAVNISKLPTQYEQMQQQMNRMEKHEEQIATMLGVSFAAQNAERKHASKSRPIAFKDANMSESRIIIESEKK